MANLQEAKARYREAREDTDLQRMYEGRSERTGNKIYQNEVDAARYYIAALEEHIAIHLSAKEYAKMTAEHMRPEGLSHGYFCLRCGGVCNMYATGHDNCIPNPELVATLRELNR